MGAMYHNMEYIYILKKKYSINHEMQNKTCETNKENLFH